MIADLHIHTTASDGLLDPVTILHEAGAAWLQKIAITDHDTIEGLLSLRKAGILSSQPLAPAIIPGIELNADFPGYEVHILGYFIDIDNDNLKNALNFLVDNRHKRLELMVNKINSLGYYLDYSRVLEIASGSEAVGRPHLAKALLEKGYFKTVGQVFETLIGRKCPAYVIQYKLPLEEVVGLIEGAGGVAVLAHPGLIGSDSIVNRIIKNKGVSGLEVYHPAHNQAEVIKYFSLAKEHNLKITGGSDFHGIAGRFPENLGMVYVSANLADELEKK